MIVQCEWGLRGIDLLRDRVGVIVIVDILSFSTAVDVATARGALVYPFAHEAGADAAARAESAAAALSAILARPRRAAGGQFGLSPASLAAIPPGTRLMLPSPNGARLSLACGDTPVLAGCLRNATTVARAPRAIAGERDIAIIPADKRWPDGSLRPAIEDWLRAGAIIAALDLPGTPKAALARRSYGSSRADLVACITDSLSGRELSAAGYADDVAMALQGDVSDGAPRLMDGPYRR